MAQITITMTSGKKHVCRTKSDKNDQTFADSAKEQAKNTGGVQCDAGKWLNAANIETIELGDKSRVSDKDFSKSNLTFKYC